MWTIAELKLESLSSVGRHKVLFVFEVTSYFYGRHRRLFHRERYLNNEYSKKFIREVTIVSMAVSLLLLFFFLTRFPGKVAPNITVNDKGAEVKQPRKGSTVEQILGEMRYVCSQ